MTFGADDETPLEALRREATAAERETICDVFLHPVVGQPDARALDEILHLVEHGCSSIKIFLSNPGFDRQIDAYVEAMYRAGASGLMTMLHCEDAALITYATRRLTEAGQSSLRYFPMSRPVVAEAVATQRAIALAESTGAPVYLVHVSSERALLQAELKDKPTSARLQKRLASVDDLLRDACQ